MGRDRRDRVDSVTALAGRLAGRLLFSLVLLVLPAVSAVAESVVTNGDDSGPGSLRDTVATAAPGDTITFASEVTIVTLTSGEIAIGKNLSIQGSGVGGVAVQRDETAPAFRIFNISGGANVTLKGLTVRGGRSTADGGGVHSTNSTLTIEDSVVADNHASGQRGGGIASMSNNGTASLTVRRSIVENNSASEVGGGIVNSVNGGLASLTLTDSTLDGNVAGIWATAISNEASDVARATMVVTGSTIRNPPESGAAVLTFAGSGGSAVATASFTNSTFVGNGAGGILAYGQVQGVVSQTLRHVTVLDTAVHTVAATQASASTSYDRSVFAFTDDDVETYFVVAGAGSTSVASGGYNVSKRDLPGAIATDLPHTDPLLDPAGLADHGGETDTVALAPASPARDLIPAEDCAEPADQRGVDRPQPSAGHCDSGAVEAASAQTITVTTPAPASAPYGTSFQVAAEASSGLAVAITAEGGCSIAGDTVTMTSGTTACLVRFNQPGNGEYPPAAEIAQTVTAQKAAQAIAFAALPDRTLGQSPFGVSATSSSGLAVTFTTTTPLRCRSIGTNGATIRLLSNGTCTVQADQAGNADYLAAPSVAQSFAVGGKNDQTISVVTAPPAAAVYGSSFPVAATATSGLAAAITAAGGCSIAGDTVTMRSGTNACVIRLNQAGNGSYNAAPQVEIVVTARKADQTIAITTAPASAVYRTLFPVAATASSGLRVSFTTAGGCSGASGNVTMTSGTTACVVRFTQTGNANYNAAPEVQASVTAQKANQTISFGALADRRLQQSPFGVSGSASSGLAVRFSTTTPGQCASGGTNGATITLLATGTCTVQADQTGNANYNPASPVTRSFTVR